MIKTRLIPTLQLKNWGLVKSKRFSEWRPIGPAVVAGKVYTARRVDELIALDIDAPRQRRGPNVGLLRDLADVCLMPFTAGGGVRSNDDVRALLANGADKIALNSAIATSPEIVEACSQEFGVQCVVASIDARRVEGGGHEVLIEAGTRRAATDVVEYACRAEALGAGEILLTSIDEDGMMQGYDLRLLSSVAEAVDIPVIACGGAGEPQHFVDAVIRGGADAVSAASIFHFTQHTPDDVKQHMREAGLDVRL